MQTIQLCARADIALLTYLAESLILPQLWNVLRGDMSLVGPRPCLPVQSDLIAARKAKGVFAVRPGVIGLAQVRGVDMSDPERLAALDAEAIAAQHFTGDLALLWMTVAGGLRSLNGKRVLVTIAFTIRRASNGRHA